MTAVDVDALDKLRDEIRDDLAGWPIGSGYYSTEIGTDDAGELAEFLLDGSLASLLAEVRRGRALREAVEGLRQIVVEMEGDERDGIPPHVPLLIAALRDVLADAAVDPS